MKKLSSSEKLINMSKANERKNRIEQGYFDGRFAPKTVPDKRKKLQNKLSREKVHYHLVF
jgi:hypothetical protein